MVQCFEIFITILGMFSLSFYYPRVIGVLKFKIHLKFL